MRKGTCSVVSPPVGPLWPSRVSLGGWGGGEVEEV